MPRKIYDFEEAEPEPSDLQKIQTSNILKTLIEMGAFNKTHIKSIQCTDEKCNFYFDLGTDETKTDAAQKHHLMTGHKVVIEYMEYI